MKQFVTVGLFLFFSIATVYSQRNYFSAIQFGVGGAGNLTAIAQENSYGSTISRNTGSFIGYSGGLSAAFIWNDTYGVQIEGNYSFIGNNYVNDFAVGEDKVDKKVTLAYMYIPIVYKHYIPTNSYNYDAPLIYLLGGIQGGKLMAADVSYSKGGTELPFLEAIGNPTTVEAPVDDKDLFLPYDFGVVGGIGVEILLEGNLSLTIESRTNIGLKDINAYNYRLPHPRIGYRKSVNLVTGLKVGVHYNLFL